MASFKSYVLAICDALGISINQIYAYIGFMTIGNKIDLSQLQTWVDWLYFILDIFRASTMWILSTSFLIFRFYAEWKKFKKEHKDDDKRGDSSK